MSPLPHWRAVGVTPWVSLELEIVTAWPQGLCTHHDVASMAAPAGSLDGRPAAVSVLGLAKWSLSGWGRAGAGTGVEPSGVCCHYSPEDHHLPEVPSGDRGKEGRRGEQFPQTFFTPLPFLSCLSLPTNSFPLSPENCPSELRI